MRRNLLKELPIEKVNGFLDSRESVIKARLSLENSTEEDYKKYEKAKRDAQEEAHKKLLD